MARLVKLAYVNIFNDSDKDNDVYVNPEYIQYAKADSALNIVELEMSPGTLRVRGSLEEVVSLLQTPNRKNY